MSGERPALGDVPAGTRIAAYQIDQLIGRGGMAKVYRATDTRLGRPVALKILADELSRDEAFRQRFVRESRAAAAIDHPNVIPVFEAGDADGVLYIAMRYVPGLDVRALLAQQGKLPVRRVVSIITQISSALDAAHALGMVHRDVKPGNMLLGTIGDGDTLDHVYLSDFGLTKLAMSANSHLTGTGQFLGTIDYMSPEQVNGKDVDGRTDQYALACAAFEMLTGTPPFRRDENLAVIWAQMSAAPPSVRDKRPELAPAVDEVLNRALAKAPGERYPSCMEFAAAFRIACAAPAPGPSPTPTQVAQPDLAMLVAPTAENPVTGQGAQGGAATELARGAGGAAMPPVGAVAVPQQPTQSPGGADTAGYTGPPGQYSGGQYGGGQYGGGQYGGGQYGGGQYASGYTDQGAGWPGHSGPTDPRAGGYGAGYQQPGYQQPGFPGSGYGGPGYSNPPGFPPPKKGKGGLIIVAVLLVLAAAAGAVLVFHPLGLLKPAATGSPKPTRTVTITPTPSQPTSASPTSQTPTSATPASPGDTVTAFYSALNSQQYQTAWDINTYVHSLMSYQAWKDGYATTTSVTVKIDSVTGDTVWVHITSQHNDGTMHYFQGWYTASGGHITGSKVTGG